MKDIDILTKIGEKWHIFLAIIIILGIVWWDLATIQSQKVEVARECNAQWREQVKKYCPAILEEGINMTEILMNDIEDFNEGLK